METGEEFREWLKKEMESRGWKQANLVHESNLDSAVISNIINGKRKVGETTATAIAHALRIPPALVFEKAGILPITSELSPKKRELLARLEKADEATVQMAIELLDVAVKNSQRKIPAGLDIKTNPR